MKLETLEDLQSHIYHCNKKNYTPCESYMYLHSCNVQQWLCIAAVVYMYKLDAKQLTHLLNECVKDPALRDREKLLKTITKHLISNSVIPMDAKKLK